MLENNESQKHKLSGNGPTMYIKLITQLKLKGLKQPYLNLRYRKESKTTKTGDNCRVEIVKILAIGCISWSISVFSV